MTEPTPIDPSIQSGSYALNALDADEKAAFEKHLATSRDTRYEVTELTDTAVLLGMAVAEEAPPASLKASIMAQLDATPQVAPITPGPAERRARARWSTRPVVAAAVVQGEQQRHQADMLAAINAAPDAQRRSVEMPGGSATLVWSGELAASALIMDGLEPLPAHQVYELWYIGETGARPAGTFSASDGRTWRVLDGEMGAGDVVGVTVEPRGGSETPTTDPIVVIESA